MSCFYSDKNLKKNKQHFPHPISLPEALLELSKKAELLLSFPFFTASLECVCPVESGSSSTDPQCLHNAVQALMDMDEPIWTPGNLHERQMKLLMRSMQHSWRVLFIQFSVYLHLLPFITVLVYVHQQFPWWYSGRHNSHLFELWISFQKTTNTGQWKRATPSSTSWGNTAESDGIFNTAVWMHSECMQLSKPLESR